MTRNEMIIQVAAAIAQGYAASGRDVTAYSSATNGNQVSASHIATTSVMIVDICLNETKVE